VHFEQVCLEGRIPLALAVVNVLFAFLKWARIRQEDVFVVTSDAQVQVIPWRVFQRTHIVQIQNFIDDCFLEFCPRVLLSV